VIRELDHHHRTPSSPVGDRQPVVIGEQQDRVTYAAHRFGAEDYKGLSPEEAGLPEGSHELESRRLEHNERWLREAIEQGRPVIDTGPAEPRLDYPEPTRGSHGDPLTPERPYRGEAAYEVECRVLKETGYQRVMRPWEDMSREPWRDADGASHVRVLDDTTRKLLTERGVELSTLDQRPWKFDPAEAERAQTDSARNPVPQHRSEPPRESGPTRQER
jgi:hypothetical protein